MIPNTTLKSQRFFLITLMLVAASLVVFTQSDVIAWYSGKYTESAHGNSTSGVNRSGLSDYSVGNCTHCHEQHASMGGSSHTAYDFGLFAPNNPTSQTDNFCFQCHKGAGSVQVGGITNYDYGATFGGGTANFTNIKDAFSASGSSHNLAAIQSHAISKVPDFTSDNNPCTTCHNPHTAQDNTSFEPSGRGGIKTAVRNMNGLEFRPTNLWGDEDKTTSGYNERIRDVTSKYKSPYRVGKTTYEPYGGTTLEHQDGSYLPNYKGMCSFQCHASSIGGLAGIDWTTTGDQHGKLHEPGAPDTFIEFGFTVVPYGNDSKNYLLACTDCHEPHGSPNEWLLRTCVNGKDNITMEWAGDWWDFCTACHGLTQATTTYHADKWEAYSPKCPVCHEHGHDPAHETFF